MSDYKAKVENVFSDLVSQKRIPHAVLIEGSDKELLNYAVMYLSMYAVCKESFRPCTVCNSCKKAMDNTHPDIYTPKLSGKTNIISVEAVRELIKDASIIPNESDTKVFILKDVDKCMAEISQNAFLKILEEPPQSTLFILTASNSKKLLSTILSRVQVFSLNTENIIDEQTSKLAKDIISGILSVSELELMYASAKLNSRPVFKETLNLVSEYLRQGLSCAVGCDNESETARLISKKLTKSRIIKLIELCSKATIRADRNVNMNLLCTWLCSELRRISWQR
ncbi:MAG: hypothetical protein IKB73_00140 [Ruminococcus sp.]|nr:hypothetical protein [Ruminococcus sp.]